LLKEFEESPEGEGKKPDRTPDVLDALISVVGERGIVALLIALAGLIVGMSSVPMEWGLISCAFAMGLGKGGVPGASTLASAFFALMAPSGKLNQMMAVMVPITMDLRHV